MNKHLTLIFLAIVMAVSFRSAAQIQILNDITCNGHSTGTLMATPGGWGTAPYYYLWSTADTSQIVHNLPAGTYSLTITDSLFIDSVFFVTLSQPAAIDINPAVVTPSDCDGHNNGAVSITVTGGVGPYSFLWTETQTDSVYTTQNISNVRGGNYMLNITDTWGCTNTFNIPIANIRDIPVGFVIDSFVCNGLLGTVEVQADSADSLNYFTYNWSTPYNSSSFTSNDSVFSASTSFLAGTYLITTVENLTGCANYSWIVIDQTPAPLVVTETVVHNQCFGDLTGSIALTPTGGLALPDYHVVWSGPLGFTSVAFSVGALTSGDYNYTVSDDSACSFSGTVRIEPLMPLQGSISLTGVSCVEGQYGTAVANFSGGSGLLSYLWSDNENTTSIPLLAPGTYSVSVTDSRGCQRTDSVKVHDGQEICLFIPNMVTANGDGFNDVFRIDGACIMDEFYIALYTPDGKNVFHSNNCNFAWDPLAYLETSSGSVYYYYIRVSNGGTTVEYKNSLNINY